MSDTANRIVPLVLGVLAVTAGGFLFYSEQQATANAEAVDATVVSAEVVNYEDANGQPRDDQDYDFRADIEYRYSYDGETYTSTNLCPGAGSGCAPSGADRSDAEEFVERYPEGETVTAYVPPGSPADAYLVEGASSSTLYLAFAGVGVVVFVLGLRRLL